MGVAELDAERHSEMFEQMFQRLKRERIEPCEICGGTGRVTVSIDWIDDIVEFPRSEMCECKKEVSLLLKLWDAGVPQEFWKADEIEPEWNVHAFDQIHHYSDRIEAAREHGLGLVLVGENGTGKSSSASIVIIAALRARMTAAFVSFPDLVQGWRIAKTNEAHGKHLSERLMRDVIVLDEVGKEYAGKKGEEVTARLDALLRMRRGAFLPTVIVTNLSYAGLVDHYGMSIGSLLNADRFKVLEYEPGDYRSELPSWDDRLGGSE